MTELTGIRVMSVKDGGLVAPHLRRTAGAFVVPYGGISTFFPVPSLPTLRRKLVQTGSIITPSLASRVVV